MRITSKGQVRKVATARTDRMLQGLEGPLRAFMMRSYIIAYCAGLFPGRPVHIAGNYNQETSRKAIGSITCLVGWVGRRDSNDFGFMRDWMRQRHPPVGSFTQQLACQLQGSVPGASCRGKATWTRLPKPAHRDINRPSVCVRAGMTWCVSATAWVWLGAQSSFGDPWDGRMSPFGYKILPRGTGVHGCSSPRALSHKGSISSKIK